MKHEWNAKLVAHGMSRVTGDHLPYYTVHLGLVLERDLERRVRVQFADSDEALRIGMSIVKYAYQSRQHTIQTQRMPEAEKDVHTEHCCRWHGCKYGDDADCPVENGTKRQSYACEQCDYEADQIGDYSDGVEAGKAQVSREVQEIIDEAFEKHTPDIAAELALRCLSEYFGR